MWQTHLNNACEIGQSLGTANTVSLFLVVLSVVIYDCVYYLGKWQLAIATMAKAKTIDILGNLC
jgi:hypothetical protein